MNVLAHIEQFQFILLNRINKEDIMNIYHFLNNPTTSRDVKSFIKRLEEAVASSFERQLESNFDNENSAVVISSQLRTEELVG